MKKSNKWEDLGFCKREITTLWGGIAEMLRRVSYDSSHVIESNEIHASLVIDQENQEFLNEFGARASPKFYMRCNYKILTILAHTRKFATIDSQTFFLTPGCSYS